MGVMNSRIASRTAHVDSHLRTTILAAVVAIVSYLAAKLAGILIITVPQMEWPLWPGCAVLVAILLLLPRKIWPVLLASGLAGFVFYDLRAGMSVHSILWLILADTVEVLVAVWGVSYALDGRIRLNSLQALAKYSFFTVFLASVIVASLGTRGLSGDRWISWRMSFLSEALAFLTVAPAVLGLGGKAWLSLRTSWKHYVEGATLIVALGTLSYFMFALPETTYPPALLYSLVPFLIWSALRFGSAGVGTSATIVALMSIWGAVHGYGPFTETNPIDRVLSLQVFLLFTSIPFMVLAVLVEENHCAQTELRESEERLRLAMVSGKAVGWEWDLNTGEDFWFGDLKAVFRTEPDSFSGSAEEFYRYVHPEDQPQVAAATADAKQNRKSYATEFRVVGPDRDVRWVEASGKFYYTPNGEPERMSGIALDITDRKQLEIELRDSQDRMEAIVTTAMDAVIVVDDQQRIVLFNPAAAQMFACPAEEALGNLIERFIPQQLPAAFIKHLRQSGHHGAAMRDMDQLGTLGAVRSDGYEFHVEASISHIDAGERPLFTLILRDVTERELATIALRESEARFRLVANFAPVLIWMCDTTKLCTYFNTPWLEFTGRSLESQLGNGWTQAVHPEDLNSCFEVFSNSCDLREKFTMQYRVRRHDGEYRWVRDVGVPRFNVDNSFAGFIGSCVDVTDYKNAQEALQESEDKLRLLLDSTAEAIYGIDLEGRCTFCNAASLRFLGYTWPDEILGKDMHDLIHHSLADGTRHPVENCRLRQALQVGEEIHIDDEVFWRASGTSFPAEYWSYPQRKGKQVVGAVVTFLDITERKGTEATLVDVGRRLLGAEELERARIARELHDDIGQRLALLTVELAQLPSYLSGLSDDATRYLGELQSQTAEIAGDVQSLSHKLHSSKLEYLGIATAMKAFCRDLSAKQKVEIVFSHDDIAKTLPSAISLCLFRVLQESLNNALKHSGVRYFEAQLRESANAIDLTIHDTGAGFEVAETMKSSAGIGLTSMSERIKLAGGKLSIQSAPGHGTTIRAHVPVREASRTASQHS
jgi:PAS domain S-box-containing protein